MRDEKRGGNQKVHRLANSGVVFRERKKWVGVMDWFGQRQAHGRDGGGGENRLGLGREQLSGHSQLEDLVPAALQRGDGLQLW